MLRSVAPYAPKWKCLLLVCCRFIGEACRNSCEAMAAGAVAEVPTMQAQLVHAHLPPVNVELSINFGGALDGQGDCRTVCVQV
jgi:hypothetical protein